MESADRESRRLDILSVKKEANLSAREVGEVEVGRSTNVHKLTPYMEMWAEPGLPNSDC